MKCTKISIGNISPTDERTLPQFAETGGAKAPIGKLVIALDKETAWSSEYTFSASVYGENPSLLISHPVFFPGPGNALVFMEKDRDVSMHGVEDAVRAYLWKLHEDLQPGIARLCQDANGIAEAALQIVVKKARAAVVAAFPEAGDIEYLPFQAAWPSLYAFGQYGRGDSLYLARAIDNEIIGGVVRVESRIFDWDRMTEEERLNRFWSELAWVFAVRELQIPGNKPNRRIVSAKEAPLGIRISQPKVDVYEIEKVTFYCDGAMNVVVEFGTNSLPAKAYEVPPLGSAIGLVDKHMTP